MFVESNKRQDLRRVDDRGVHPGFYGIVQKYRIEHDPCRRAKTERDIRHAENDVRLGHLCAYLLDRIDRLGGVLAVFLYAGRDRKRERIEEDIVSLDAEFGRLLVGASGDLELVFGGASHSGLVDQSDYDARTELFRKFEQLYETLFAVLVVRRIQDRFAACVFEAGFHLLPLGGIEHQRDLDVGHEPFCKFVHIGNAIAADKIDVHVKNVRTFFFLRFRKVHEAVPILGIEQVAHLLRARRIHTLANDQKRSILSKWLLEIDRRCGRRKLCVSLFWRKTAEPFDQKLYVIRRGSAAAADDIRSEILRESLDLRRKALGSFVVMLLAVLHLRQTGIRQDRDRQRRILTQMAKAVGHLLWPCAAVHTDNVDRERFEGRQCGADLGAVQHRTENLDRHLRDHGNSRPRLRKMVEDRGECRLCLKQILTGLNYQNVAAAVDKPADLFSIGIF